MLSDLLNSELWTLGGSRITIASVLVALAVFAGALAVSWLFTRFMNRLRKHSRASSSPALYVAGQVGRYVIIVIGLIMAGSAIGLNLTSLSLFAGALGIGIGLGVQDIVKDFIAGLVLLFDRSIEVGDFIEIEAGVTGEIKTIGARATVILTNDNVDVLVPNSSLLTNRLVNWTRNRATRRVHVPFGVAYGSDKETVRRAALEAAQAVPFTLPDAEDRRTQVWLIGFGDSALEFELVVWPTLEAVKRPGSMMAAYRWAIDDALRKHRIEIPFPQRDIRIRSFFGGEEQAGLEAWRGEKLEAPAAAQPVAPPSTNDAAEEIAQKQQKVDRLQTSEGMREVAETMDKAREALNADPRPKS